MSHTSWTQPALQLNEAVLLPALERVIPVSGRLPLSSPIFSSPAEAFIPVASPAPITSSARTFGSMAGRSVLRAAGVRTEPICRRRRTR